MSTHFFQKLAYYDKKMEIKLCILILFKKLGMSNKISLCYREIKLSLS